MVEKKRAAIRIRWFTAAEDKGSSARGNTGIWTGGQPRNHRWPRIDPGGEAQPVPLAHRIPALTRRALANSSFHPDSIGSLFGADIHPARSDDRCAAESFLRIFAPNLSAFQVRLVYQRVAHVNAEEPVFPSECQVWIEARMGLVGVSGNRTDRQLFAQDAPPVRRIGDQQDTHVRGRVRHSMTLHRRGVIGFFRVCLPGSRKRLFVTLGRDGHRRGTCPDKLGDRTLHHQAGVSQFRGRAAFLAVVVPHELPGRSQSKSHSAETHCQWCPTAFGDTLILSHHLAGLCVEREQVMHVHKQAVTQQGRAAAVSEIHPRLGVEALNPLSSTLPLRVSRGEEHGCSTCYHGPGINFCSDQ